MFMMEYTDIYLFWLVLFSRIKEYCYIYNFPREILALRSEKDSLIRASHTE